VSDLSLGQKQRLFVRLLGGLMARVYASGYELTFGEAYRTDEQAVINSLGEVGRARLADVLERDFPALAVAVTNNGKGNGILLSLHGQRLAVDFNLFKDGVYLTTTEAWAPFGEWWEGQHALARWGGRFKDGNHFSIEHQGRR
jgi:hypothetical protein